MSGEDRRPIILASQSPQRAMLLTEAGIAFEVASPPCEEPDPAAWSGTPIEYAEHTSRLKAHSVASLHPDRVILAADTVVALADHIIGKPADRDDARRILTMLGGSDHEVITGVTVLHTAGGRECTRHAITRGRMRAMPEEELSAYLDGGLWQGKAGAYGIQDDGDPFVTLLEGSFSNVVGLPIELVGEMLAPLG